MFAEDGRVEAGCHCEEVTGRVGVVETSEVVGKFLGGYVRHLGQRQPDVLVGAMEAFGEGIHLDPVAGGQHHRLGHVLA